MNSSGTVSSANRAVRALLLGLLAAAPLSAQLRELYVVTDPKAEFYRERRLQRLNLQEGDIVEGEAHSVYRGWLKILADGQAYDTRAKYFISRAKMRESLARNRADLLSRIERNTDRIDDALDEIAQYNSAIAAIRFDSTVQFRVKTIRTVVPRTDPATDPRPGGRRPSMAPTVSIGYNYVDKISMARARTQARRWETDVEKLEKSVNDWEDRRRADIATLATAEHRRQAIERRFRAYTANRRTQLPTPYLVLEETTDLYDGKQPVGQLRRDQIVLGRPNARFRRWIQLQVGGRTLDGHAEHFAARDQVEAETAARAARLAQLVADLEGQVGDLASQEKLLRSLRLSLEYESRLAQAPLATYPFAVDYAGRTLYNSRLSPKDSVQMINGSRARSVQKDWDRQLEDLRTELKNQRRRLQAARRDLAVTEAKAAERSQLFRQLDPAEQIAPTLVAP